MAEELTAYLKDNNVKCQFLHNEIKTMERLTILNQLRAISSTFLAFSDYNKAAIRLGEISEIPLISIYSHDSITVGEDGPTHSCSTS